MPTRIANDPNHWRERAAQMRALALTMKDTEVVILMNDLAADYASLLIEPPLKPTVKSHRQTANRARRSGAWAPQPVGRLEKKSPARICGAEDRRTGQEKPRSTNPATVIKVPLRLPPDKDWPRLMRKRQRPEVERDEEIACSRAFPAFPKYSVYERIFSMLMTLTCTQSCWPDGADPPLPFRRRV
jgi:hypothetical protein